MRYNKNRFALLAGLDNRDQYFGKTLHENYSYGLAAEAEDDLDAVEDAEVDTPLDVEAGEEAPEAEAEGDMVSKEDIAAALADVLDVDAEELSALVTAEEEPEAEAEEEPEAEAEEEPELAAEARVRRAIRKEIRKMVSESRRRNTDKQFRKARRHKSVAVAMGFKK